MPRKSVECISFSTASLNNGVVWTWPPFSSLFPSWFAILSLMPHVHAIGAPMTGNVSEINQQVCEQRERLLPLFKQIQRVIVGQKVLIERMLMGLITGGHILLEGVPGLAKTLAVRTLAQGLRLSFHRIQFTPDLLPADVVGTQIYNPRTGEFTIKKGPILANPVLEDDINRAPAKVQSALLEAMQEKQVTIGDTSYILTEPFLVLATQNPIEQEGTYPLPEAQQDRFLMKV